MKTYVLFAVAAAVFLAPPVLASDGPDTSAGAVVEIKVGRLIYGARGEAIAAVNRKTAKGDPQVILEGRFITVPAATVSEAGGKLVTSLTRQELLRRK